jgi:hypothetical protein
MELASGVAASPVGPAGTVINVTIVLVALLTTETLLPERFET